MTSVSTKRSIREPASRSRIDSTLQGLLLPLTAVLLGACAECKTTADCGAGKICVSDKCRASNAIQGDTDDTQPEKPTPSNTDTEDFETAVTGDTTSESETETETETGSETATCVDPAFDCPASSDCAGYVCDEGACLLVSAEGDACGDTDDPCVSGICIDDSCEPLPLSNTSCASDDNECTQDVCIAGVCEHRPSNGGSCPDDGNPCTEDVCVNGACGAPQSGISCDTDETDCRLNICLEGVCTGTDKPDGLACDNGLWCDGSADVCNAGICLPLSGSEPCVSSDPCVASSCDEPTAGSVAGKCAETLLTDSPCDDGVFCNGDDICDQGVCTHVNPPCPPGTAPCAIGVCNELSKTCETQDVTDGDPCRVQDGLLCNGTERCEAGTCIAGDKFCPVFSDCTQNICIEGEDGAEPTCEGIEPANDGEPCESTAVCEGSGARRCLDGVCADGETPACAPREQDRNLCTRYTLCFEEDSAPVCAVEEDNRGGFLGIGCGQTIAFDTTQENNEVSAYAASACEGEFTGGEVVYEIFGAGVRYTASLTVTKSTMQNEAIYLLKVDDPCAAADTCTNASSSKVSGINSFNTNTPDVIVVDGTGGNRGKGFVTLFCN